MKRIFVIFTMSLVLLCLGMASLAQEIQTSFDFGPDDQTKRVTEDCVMKGMLRPFIKKYGVDCKIHVIDTEKEKNPHWTCLNNMSCSYSLKVGCFDKKLPTKQVLDIEVDGFDN